MVIKTDCKNEQLKKFLQIYTIVRQKIINEIKVRGIVASRVRTLFNVCQDLLSSGRRSNRLLFNKGQ